MPVQPKSRETSLADLGGRGMNGLNNRAVIDTAHINESIKKTLLIIEIEKGTRYRFICKLGTVHCLNSPSVKTFRIFPFGRIRNV